MMNTMQDKLRSLVILSALALAACGNDNGGDVPDGGANADAGPDAACEIEPTFTSLHNKVLSSGSCVASGCHNSAAVNGQAGNLDLSGGSAAVYAELTTETSAEVGAGLPNRVLPMNPNSSFLYRKLTEDDPPGTGGRMPLACTLLNTCLPQCQLDAFEAWIQAGAANN
jgi:hypothetical protein